MIKGIENFREYFKDYSDNYVIIGGCACDLLFNEAGINFRATKDIDMVVLAQALNSDFVQKFWDYVKLADYYHINKSTNKPQYYRFSKPKDNSFPSMIELFSRKTDVISLPENIHLTPLPIDDELSSLSAILLNESYYQMLVDGTTKIDGVPLIDVPQLIAFKAKAWLDLSEKKAQGDNIDSRDIRKHKNDVLRLSQLLVPDTQVKVSQDILNDFNLFINKAVTNDINLKQLNIKASHDLIRNRLSSLFVV